MVEIYSRTGIYLGEVAESTLNWYQKNVLEETQIKKLIPEAETDLPAFFAYYVGRKLIHDEIKTYEDFERATEVVRGIGFDAISDYMSFIIFYEGRSYINNCLTCKYYSPMYYKEHFKPASYSFGGACGKDAEHYPCGPGFICKDHSNHPEVAEEFRKRKILSAKMREKLYARYGVSSEEEFIKVKTKKNKDSLKNNIAKLSDEELLDRVNMLFTRCKTLEIKYKEEEMFFMGGRNVTDASYAECLKEVIDERGLKIKLSYD